MDPARARTYDLDDWIESAPAFSRPLVSEVRRWIQRWEPDLTESIKWNNLCFSGRKLVCALSACKKHAGFSFFRGTELPDPHRLLTGQETNTSILTLRLTSLDDLDRDALRTLLHAAVEFDADPSIPPAPRQRREPLPMPDFFAEALEKQANAAAGFHSLSPTGQREYLVWLSTAKRPETRAARLEQTLAALASGLKWAQRKQANPRALH